MKMCYKCKIEKESFSFNKNKSKKDGLTTECRSCIKEYADVYRKKNKQRLLHQSRLFKDNNRESINSKNRKRYLTSKLDPIFMDKKRKSNRVYKYNNKGKINSDTAKRHSNKLNRLSITSEEDLLIIKSIYKEARKLSILTNIPHHVDHIIPLQGELVSGLHLSLNLQILTQHENCSKHNSYIV